jgi:lipopolysaccharide transport system ATP-binding protein
MSQPIIQVNDIAKLYRLGFIGTTSIREVIESVWLKLSGKNGQAKESPHTVGFSAEQLGPEPNTFWALQNVNFEVQPGEVIGLIGRNGAGKSTLLKILSRITEPTRGRAILRGRVASLLEVGTGFHPELSGRENIFLNGAMLGMKHAEIKRKFDAIADFAQVGDFLDTPVKRYSSGMYVRLAFAVAAHLEPEILLVDEVLAVGDAAFQKKCLGKMDEVAKHGRTVIVVSHNMASILSLCQRAILMRGGQVAADGPAREVVKQYLESTKSDEIVDLDERRDREGDASARLTAVKISGNDTSNIVHCTSRLNIAIRYRAPQPLRHARVLVTLYDYSNTGIYHFNSDAVHGLPEEIPADGLITCTTDPINITPGRCYLNIAIYRGDIMADSVQYAVYFDIEDDDFFGTGMMPPRENVLTLLKHNWSSGATG